MRPGPGGENFKRSRDISNMIRGKNRSTGRNAGSVVPTGKPKPWGTITAAVAVLVFAGGVFGFLLLRSGQEFAETAGALPTPNSYGQLATPPWPAPQDPEAGAEAAGLEVAPMGGVAQHFHAHLDIFVNGTRVPVPANIGIAPGSGMSPLHTHDSSGVIHVEAPTQGNRYILGQLFNEWNVRLTDSAIGGLEAQGGKQLVAYVDGKKVTGNPAAIELTPKRQIALVYGPNPEKVDVPSSYDFSSAG